MTDLHIVRPTIPMRPLLLGALLAAAASTGCSYASIDTCYDDRNTLSATLGGQPFDVQCVDAGLADDNDGEPTLGIFTSPAMPGTGQFQLPSSLNLTVRDPQPGRTYPFAGTPVRDFDDDPPFPDGAFLLARVSGVFTNESPETGTLTLTTFSTSGATGTFETTVNGQSLTGSFDVTY